MPAETGLLLLLALFFLFLLPLAHTLDFLLAHPLRGLALALPSIERLLARVVLQRLYETGGEPSHLAVQLAHRPAVLVVVIDVHFYDIPFPVCDCEIKKKLNERAGRT